MRPSLIVLALSIGLACAAPVKIDHEAAAKKFMGELLNVAKTENHTASKLRLACQYVTLSVSVSDA